MQEIEVKVPEFVDPETGEVTDRVGYFHAQGIDQHFVVKDEASMLWYLRKRMRAEQEAERIKEQFQAALDRAKSEIKTLDFLFQADAKVVARMIADEEGKQTVITPYGTLRFSRSTKGIWRVKNEDQLQTWLRFLPEQTKDVLGVKPTIFTRNLEKIKALAEAHRLYPENSPEGEIPGLEYKEPGESFSIGYSKPKE